MSWIKRFNEALDYMEDNLTGDISLDEAARLACCSVYHFQRMFSYIAGVTLSEYLRRRRLTYAAFDLQNGDKVLDVALRYGYESPTSFNRAFQAVHGISPSAAQKSEALLRSFPRISFQLTIKGGIEMEYRIVKKDAFRVVGVRIPISMDMEENFKAIPKFWQDSMMSGKPMELMPLMSGEPKGLLGVSVMKSEKEMYYYIAVASDKPAPEGMYEEAINANTWAVFPGTGSSADMQELMKRIATEWLPSSDYEWKQEADVEVYLNDDSVNMEYEIMIPVEHK